MKKLLLNVMLFTSVALAFGQNSVLRNVSLIEDVKLKNGFETVSPRGEALQQNLDFESWYDDYASLFGEMPNGWFMQTGNLASQKVTDAQSGNYAMRVESNVITNQMLGWVDTLVGGQAYIGQVEGMAINQGESFNQRPESMSFYTRGNMMNSDTAVVLIQLYNNSNTFIGGAIGLYGNGDLSNEWEQHTIDFNYVKDLTPTKAMMIVTSTGVGIFQGVTMGTVSQGSYIDIDNMSLEIHDAVAENTLVENSIYPNPAQDFVVIDNAFNSTVFISNMLGQVVWRQQIQSTHEQIDVSQLQDGVYVVRIEKEGNAQTYKLRVTK